MAIPIWVWINVGYEDLSASYAAPVLFVVYLVLLHIRRTSDAHDFMATIKRYPVAGNLFVAYCKQQVCAAASSFCLAHFLLRNRWCVQDLGTLKGIYKQTGRMDKVAHTILREAYASQSIDQRLSMLQTALGLYKQTPQAAFHAKWVNRGMCAGNILFC